MNDKPPVSQYAQGSNIAQATQGGTAIVNVVLPPAAVQEQNRVRFLKRLRYRYGEQWEQSLEGAALMTLGFTSKPDAVLHHTDLLFLSPQRPEHPLPQGTSIAQVYEQAAQELLILGEPGSGKTTLLLELARQLVERAEQDTTQLLPVIIPLSTWAIKRQSLADWMGEQLAVLYDVPRRVSYGWVQTEQILPLLDGLDEIPQETRITCLEAIITYRKEHMVPLVVCSRRTEYEEIARKQRLTLHSAVVVQPLTQEQVRAYLLQGGDVFAAVRTVLDINPVLQELITTPLMLHILTLTYTGVSADTLPRSGTTEEQQRTIFTSYVEHMVAHRRTRSRFSFQQTVSWLSWLARQVRQHDQSVFYIEWMQPDWLSEKSLQQIYELLAIRFSDILIGACMSLLIVSIFYTTVPPVLYILYFGILGGLLGELISEREQGKPLPERSIPFWRCFWPNLFKFRYLKNGVIVGLGVGGLYAQVGWNYGLAYGLSFGFVSVLLSVILKEWMVARSHAETTDWSRRNLLSKLISSGYLYIGLCAGLSYALAYVLSTELAHQLHTHQGDVLAYAVALALQYTLVGIFLCVILEGRKPGIQPAEIIVWSWRNLWRSLVSLRHVSNALLVGAIIGVIIGVIIALSAWLGVESHFGPGFGLSVALIFGLSYWLLLGLFKGLSSDMLEEYHRLRPNQGIRRSAQNSVLVGFVSGLVGWIVFCISSIVGLSVSYGMSSGLSFGLNYGSKVGLIVGVCVGIIVCLLSGGLACVQHYTLRLLLWRSKAAPWNYPRFLEYADNCILLHKVGGGYTFIHRLLLSYFASVEKASHT